MNKEKIDQAWRKYEECGFACIKDVFSPGEIDKMAAAVDQVQAKANQHPATFRYKNVYFRLAGTPHGNRGENRVRMVQWPAYFSPELNDTRLDMRFHALLAPHLGPDIKQIINQIHWKPHQAPETSFGFHQDIRFRRPRGAYRTPERYYIQTAIAIDPQGPENGGMVFLKGSHKFGELALSKASPVLGNHLQSQDLSKLGLDTGALQSLTMAPGDVAFWNVLTIHGSGPNADPNSERRLYINGYVAAEHCDRGEWAFRSGQPVALGEPTLVHYENLFHRPGPFYEPPRTPGR